MHQLTLFETPPAEHDTPVWMRLDEASQAALVAKLAEMIARTAPAKKDSHDE